MVHLTLETEQEDDGRWIAEIPELPGVLACGQTEQEAIARAEALGLRVIAERPDFLYQLDAEPAPPAEPALTR